MAKTKKRRVRRRASEWAKIVGAWKRSGQTAPAFAEDIGVSPHTLTWWSWKLASEGRKREPPTKRKNRLSGPRSSRSSGTARPRLVAIDVVSTDEPTVAWELHNSRGDTLRVMSGVAPNDLDRVLATMLNDKTPAS